MKPTNTIGYLLQHTATILLRQSDAVMQEKLGIGMAQFKILMMVRHKPNAQQHTIAEFLGQTEASISRQIKLLSEKGLLTITVDPHSRRQHLTVATTAGEQMTRDAMQLLHDHNAPLFDSLTEDELAQLRNILAKLHTHICAPGKPFACDHPFKN